MNCAKDLHTKLRDEKYLLGKELNNYDNARKQEELQQEKKEEKIKVDWKIKKPRIQKERLIFCIFTFIAKK